jgi:hypothetical protein
MILNSPYISGSLTVTGNIIASGSITLSGSVASASYAASATSASYALNATTSSFALNSTSASFATRAITASYADALTVAGTLTAQTLVVQTITSSVDFVTGSTRFGSILDNTHIFTGSVSITGSLALAGNITSNGTAVVLGSGTTNYLPKFTGASTIGDSLIQDDGTTVTIGAGAGVSNTVNIISDTSILRISGLGFNANRNYGSLEFYNTDGSQAGPNVAAAIRVNSVQSDGSGGVLTFHTSLGTESEGTPAATRLTINGSGAATFSSTILSANNIFTGGNNTGIFLTGATNDYSWGLNRESAGLTLYAGSAVSPKMTITSGGNVGIGTSTPDFKLDVNGVTQIRDTLLTTKQVGFNYTQTSSSGTTSFVNTGIFYNTSITGFLNNGTYFLAVGGNPNGAGSNEYRAVYLGYIFVTTGYDFGITNVVQRINYTQIVTGDPLNIGALTISVVFWDGTTETTQQVNGTTNNQIRIKISGYNSGNIGAAQEVRLIKIN